MPQHYIKLTANMQIYSLYKRNEPYTGLHQNPIFTVASIFLISVQKKTEKVYYFSDLNFRCHFSQSN